MTKTNRIKWVEPRIVNMEQLPLTLGECVDGSTAGSAGGPPGLIKCSLGGVAGNSQCKVGNEQVKS